MARWFARLLGVPLLMLLLIGGIRFLPTNIFLCGTVLDAATGQPIANAELTLFSPPVASYRSGWSGLAKWWWKLMVSWDALSPQGLAVSRVRSYPDGYYTLPVGWYASEKEVRITASGYTTLQKPLGPRPPGTRRIQSARVRAIGLRAG